MTDLLCTAPWDPSLSSLPPRGADDYLAAIRKLFSASNQTILIVSPFIDAEGAKQVEAWSAGTSAKIRMFVREAKTFLRDAANRNGWDLYEYAGTEGHDQRRGYHCKFFVGDQREAVLGSVNLIYHNMIENLELGFRTDEPRHVMALVDVANAIERASRRV